MTDQPVKRALISVFDKRGIVDFARDLAARDVQLLSTGGTAKLLSESGLEVTEVSKVTGFPEIMGGRVKTLHPTIHGGLLGRRGSDDEVMAEQGIEAIDLLVVNLYPFAETLARPNASESDIVEMIDIGGPAMLRAGAKNHQRVTVLTDPADYQGVLAELDEHGATSLTTRKRLAAKTFALTCAYDAGVSNFLHAQATESAGEESHTLPETLNLHLSRIQTLRYGENPHQAAAFYRQGPAKAGTIGGACQHQGKPLSYNNIADAAAALACVNAFDSPACVIVKHANPCGIALRERLRDAYQAAFACDKESAFGGILAFNRVLDAATAAAIVGQQFAEVIVAPEFEAGALKAFSSKKNLRVLATGEVGGSMDKLRFQWLEGGMLVQQPDHPDVGGEELKVVTQRAPSDSEWADLKFAWRVVQFIKSNAIVYARNGQTLGIGPGQTSRVMSARIAVLKAQTAAFDLAGSAIASDAFFPFRDGVDAAAKAGARAVIQPGGSVRDEEVIAAADEHGMAMVFTGVRHFLH